MTITAKTSAQAIIDAVNAENLGLNLTLEQVTVGDATSAEGAANGETTIVLTAIKDKGFTGTATIEYTRQPTKVAIEALGPCVIPADVTEEQAIKDWIVANHLSKSPVPMDENFELTVNVDAKLATASFSNHKILFGNFGFVYTTSVPDLNDAVEVKTLDGFKEEDVKPLG